MGLNVTARLVKTGILLTVCVGLFSCTSSEESETVGNWKWIGDTQANKRSYAVGVVAIDRNQEESIFFGLGYDGSSGTQTRLSDWWSYNPATDRHTRLQTFPGSPRQGAVAFVIGTKIFVGTGYDGSNYYMDFWEYDITGDSWRMIEPLPLVATDYTIQGVYGGIAFSDGQKGYVGTGYQRATFHDTDRDITSESYINDFFSYEIGTGWTRLNKFPSARRGAEVFTIKNEGSTPDDIYVCSGFSGGTLIDLYKYQPATDTWEELRNVANSNPHLHYDDHYSGIARYDGVAWGAGGKGYLALGSSGYVWEYNPKGDLWRQKTSFEGSGASRLGALGFYINGWGYILTGSTGTSTYYNDIWLFQPNAELYRGDNSNDSR